VKDDAGATYGFEDDIIAMYVLSLRPTQYHYCGCNLDTDPYILFYSPFSGTALSDVAFYHKATKTLIVGDLVYNLPNTESMPSALNFLWKTFSPGGTLHGKLIAGAAQNREAVVADAKKVSELEFQRIIPLHGVSSASLLYL
jgi:hypothetical protein